MVCQERYVEKDLRQSYRFYAKNRLAVEVSGRFKKPADLTYFHYLQGDS
jgi:hypothetical protein